jgi:hypothetical protein
MSDAGDTRGTMLTWLRSQHHPEADRAADHIEELEKDVQYYKASWKQADHLILNAAEGMRSIVEVHLEAKLKIAEDALDTILQDASGFNRRGPMKDGIKTGEFLPHIAHLCERVLKQIRGE